MLRWKRVEISAGALLLGAALYYLDEQGVLLMAFVPVPCMSWATGWSSGPWAGG